MIYMYDQEIIRELNSRNVRITPQRLKILSYLRSTKTHPTAEEIYNKVNNDVYGLSLATVYNTLNLLKEHNLVTELKYGDLASRFDGFMDDHYHAYCKSCGKVEDFQGAPIEAVQREAEIETGFTIDNVMIDFYGTCADCRKQEQN